MHMYTCRDPYYEGRTGNGFASPTQTTTRSLTEFGRWPAVVVELLRGGRGLI